MEELSTDEQRQFSRLYEAHYAQVLGYARRRSTPSVAEDVAHETFFVAWRRLPDVPGEPLPWLLAVARRVLANDRRSSARREALIDRLASTASIDAAPTAPRAVLSPPIREALLSLPAMSLEALLLTAWEGLSPSAAAQALGCSQVTFRARLYRARKALAAAIDANHHCATAPAAAPTLEGAIRDVPR
jgi:RNA polymerase sigma factor (sigma-70 family)